ncbi:helix-turn-helix domain-containing protein [Escherichia coli]|nr:helix-turn-helix domain-containing protein [Escherichia coli]
MNWTQERAAEEFGISLATYKRYEKGEPPRSLRWPFAFCRLTIWLRIFHTLIKMRFC